MNEAPWTIKRDGMGNPIDPDRHYYVADTRQMVGNCMLFWAKDRKGYTTQLDQAGLYRGNDLPQRDSDVPWLPEDLEPGKVIHVRRDRLSHGRKS